MELEFKSNEITMNKLLDEFALLSIQMNAYLVDIRAIAEKHRTSQIPC